MITINGLTAQSNIAKFNFAAEGALDNDQLRALIETKGHGRFTIDIGGKLTVFTPPEKRDNFLVAFFKRHFTWNTQDRLEYQMKERLLDNMDLLAKNITFQQKIVETLRQKATETMAFNSRAAISQLDEALNNFVNKKKGSFTVESLKTLVKNEITIRQQIDQIRERAPLINHYDCTVLPPHESGTPVNVFEFIASHLDPAKVDPAGKIFQDGKLDDEYLIQRIIARCVQDPDDFNILDCRNEALAVRAAITGEKIRDYERDDTIYSDPSSLEDRLTPIVLKIKQKLAVFARSARNLHKADDQTAEAMYGMLKSLCGPAKKNVLKGIFGSGKLKAQLNQMPSGTTVSQPVYGQSAEHKIDLTTATAAYLADHGITKEAVGQLEVATGNSVPDLYGTIEKALQTKNVDDFLTDIDRLGGLVPSQPDTARILAMHSVARLYANTQSDNKIVQVLEGTKMSLQNLNRLVDSCHNNIVRLNNLMALQQKLELFKATLRCMVEFMDQYAPKTVIRTLRDDETDDFFRRLDERIKNPA